MHDRKLNGFRKRLFFTHQLTKQKRSLYLQGSKMIATIQWNDSQLGKGGGGGGDSLIWPKQVSAAAQGIVFGSGVFKKVKPRCDEWSTKNILFSKISLR